MKNRRNTNILCIAFCCILLISCDKKQEVKQSTEYAVMEITPSDRTITNQHAASIKGRQDIDIYPQVSGYITKLCVKEGEKVKKGQVLFVIDQIPYQAEYKTAQANVQACKVGVATAQLTYDSKKELFAKNIVSKFDLQTAENKLESAKAQLDQALAQELRAKNNLSYTEVKSPSDGVVGTLPYRIGASVSPALQVPLTTISDNSKMHIYFSLTERQLLSLLRQYGSMEQVLEAMPEIDLVLSDNSTYSEKGKIESISGVIDQATGSVSVRAVFPNDKGVLVSGASGNVLIPESISNAMVIPQKATFEIQDKLYAYKVVDGKATTAIIEGIALNGGKEFAVVSGLQNGDTIVTEGVATLREGTPITAKTQKEG